jgi:hypothetical protein
MYITFNMFNKSCKVPTDHHSGQSNAKNNNKILPKPRLVFIIKEQKQSRISKILNCKIIFNLMLSILSSKKFGIRPLGRSLVRAQK